MQLPAIKDKHERRFLGFLLKHLIYGTVGGVVFGVLILWFDIAGLWTMIADSPDRELSLILLFFGLFITFGSLGMAVGVMQLGEERD
jgi:hypothetical protein